MKPVIKRGGVLTVLEDENIFREKLTVLNHSIAWHISGDRDESNCIYIDQFSVFNSPAVDDLPEEEPLPDVPYIR